MSLKSLLASAAVLGVAHAGCSVTATGSEDILLRGTILTINGAVENGRVLVQSGKITYVGTQRNLEFPHNATVITCTDSVISPGFINTHEHIGYSTVSPLPDTGERVHQRHDWRVGLRGNKLRPAPVNGSEAEATAWGELRHIFSGTTSILGGAMAPGLARNLDFVVGLEDGLRAPTATLAVFPLNDAAGIVRHGDCDYGPNATDSQAAGKLNRYIAHVGEGIDAEAENEFRCLSNGTFDLHPLPGGGGLSSDIMASNVALIHALGLADADFDLVAQRGAKIVWSPRSNIFLYGKTLNVTYLVEAGITVALGTDWLPSGSATMAREAVCGYSATNESYDRVLEPQLLWEMMTVNAAEVAGFRDSLGSLDAGKMADIVVFGGKAREDAFAQAVFSSGEDIKLVMRGGKILLADDEIKSVTRGACEPVLFGNTSKTVCVESDLGMSFTSFETSLKGVYPAVLPGIPPNEPSCQPSRA